MRFHFFRLFTCYLGSLIPKTDFIELIVFIIHERLKSPGRVTSIQTTFPSTL